MTLIYRDNDINAVRRAHPSPMTRLIASQGGGGGGTVGTGGPGTATIAVQDETGTWSLTPARAAEVHATGGVIMWVTRSGGAQPTEADGAVLGHDVINGAATTGPGLTNLTTVQVPTNAVPVATDAPGTASDTITLTKVEGITWKIGQDGTAQFHDAASFTGTTKVVPYGLGTSVEVAAQAAPGYVLTGTAAWTLAFTNTSTTTTVTIPAASYPTGQDVPGTASDTITLTKVEGITWTVDGTDHASSAFTGTTKTVPYTKGTATTVTAKGDTGYTVAGTASWQLAFTNAAAAPWALLGEFTFTEADTDIAVNDTRTNGSLTLKVTKGGASIAGNRLVLATGADRTLTVTPSATVGTKWAVEYDVVGRPTGYGYNTNYFAQIGGGTTEFGVVYRGTWAMFSQDSGYVYGTQNSDSGMTPGIPLTTGTNTIRYETDTTAGTCTVYSNGTLVAAYAITTSMTRPSLGLRISAYATEGTIYDNIRFYKAA